MSFSSDTLISVIVVSLNGAERLPSCLAAVYASDWPALEVIVVDNGSSDDTSAVVRRVAPEAMMIRVEHNLGFAGGNNLGLAQARGDMVILLNDDCEPRADWLRALARAAERWADWGVVGCKLLYPGGRVIQHAGGTTEPNGLTQHLGYMEEDHGQWDEPGPRDYVTGAAFAIRRRVLDEVGMLDAAFFPIYFEENDYCRRTRAAGFGVYYEPAAVVIHHESRTTGKMSFGFLRKYHRNRIRFVLKNFTGAELWRAVRREVSWLIRHQPWDQAGALLLEYCDTLLRAPSLWRARKKNRR